MTAGQKKRDAFQEVTPENAGQTLFTRCERETLVRFPKTQAILFTIRTYIRNLAWYAARPNECATLADALRNLPEDLVSHHMTCQAWQKLARKLGRIISFACNANLLPVGQQNGVSSRGCQRH